MADRRAILKKSVQMGVSIALSKVLGMARELLMARYLGAGMAADAFITAFRIPNSLRKIFAEGALSAALIPVLVKVYREESACQAHALVTLTFGVIQTLLALLCALVSYYAPTVMHITAPGFDAQALAYAIDFVRILIFYILFISSSATLSAALQAKQHFFMPANGQVFLNITFISTLLVASYYKLSFAHFAYLLLANGLFLLLMHVVAYSRAGGRVVLPSWVTWHYFKQVMKKFLPCLITIGSLEINLYIDNSMASYLPPGSVSLLYYTSAFLRLPLSIFAVAFSTILLPSLTRVGLYAPKRLRYYLFEATKLMIWVSFFCTALMIFFAERLFLTVWLSEKFPLEKVMQAGQLLSIFAFSLLFLSLNKILITIFYARHDTWRPTVISLVGALCNTFCNFILIQFFKVNGIALATVIASALQTALFFYVLHNRYGLALYWNRLSSFMLRVTAQMLTAAAGFFVLYTLIERLMLYFSAPVAHFFTQSLGYWLWTLPLCAIVGAWLYVSRTWYGIRMYFLES